MVAAVNTTSSSEITDESISDDRLSGVVVATIIIIVSLLWYHTKVDYTGQRGMHLALLTANKQPIKSINVYNLDSYLITRIQDLEEMNNCYYLFIVDDFWSKYQDPMMIFSKNRIISIDDEKSFLRSLAYAYKHELLLKIIIETYGGDVRSSDIISKSLLNYPYKSEIYVLNYAFSAGAFIALSANELYMNKWAFLGPVDPQLPIGETDMYASRDLIYALNNKASLEDATYLTAVRAQVYHEDNLQNLNRIFTAKNYSRCQIKKIVNKFASGDVPHGKPFSVDELSDIKIQVYTDISDDISVLYDIFKDVESVFH